MAAILLTEKTMTNSESSYMDPFQGQMNIISRTVDKYNYDICNMMCTPQIKVGNVYM